MIEPHKNLKQNYKTYVNDVAMYMEWWLFWHGAIHHCNNLVITSVYMCKFNMTCVQTAQLQTFFEKAGSMKSGLYNSQ